MGQKTVRFSDLSGELITRDDTLARIVIQEHPELGDSPVEIEALADEAAAIGKSALRVAVVELYLPGEEEPHRVTMDAAAFDKLATDKPMSELMLTARPARPARRTRAAATARAARHQLRHPGARGRAAQGPDHRGRAGTGPRPPGRDQRAAGQAGHAHHRPEGPGARRPLRPDRPGRSPGRPGRLALLDDVETLADHRPDQALVTQHGEGLFGGDVRDAVALAQGLNRRDAAGLGPGDGRDDPRAQLGGADHGVHRADLDGAVHAVHPVELGGHLGQLLGAYRGPHLGQLGGQLGPFRISASGPGAPPGRPPGGRPRSAGSPRR